MWVIAGIGRGVTDMHHGPVSIGVVVIGAGGFGRQMPWIIRDMCSTGSGDLRFEGFADDCADSNTVEGYPIIGTIDAVLTRDIKPTVVCALGDPRVRKRILEKCFTSGAKAVSLVHPSVLKPDHVRFANACIVSAGTVISTNVSIGVGALLNLGCRVGHDVDIGAFASLMPNVSVGGESVIGEGAFVGIGASISNRVTVGEWSVVGAGAVVLKDVPPRAIVAGVPSRAIGYVAPDATATPI